MDKRIGILTGGGDVPPLNAVIHSAYEYGRSNGVDVIGLTRGWQGLLEETVVDIGKLKLDPAIGGTVLKSSRTNLSKVDDAYSKIRKSLDDLNLDGLIVIGGEDTLSNAFHLRDIPQVLISKTIDNDVGINEAGRIVNYFTLGYPTGAQKISSLVSLSEGLRTTAYSHERIVVVESMGMHAGWLAIASSLGHPDFIIIPEFPLYYDLLVEKVADRFQKHRNVIIVISEGAKWSDGSYISADEKDLDNFGHPKFKGAADLLAKKLKADLGRRFNTKNVNSVNPSYLYRSGNPNELDYRSAAMLGKDAINMFAKGLSEPVFLTLKNLDTEFIAEPFCLKELSDIEEFHRFVDERYYDPGEFEVAPEGLTYLDRIVRKIEMPQYGF